METVNTNTALNEHESVQKVYTLLQNHGMGQEKQDMESLVKHMELLEVQFDKVFQELGEVKGQLDRIQNRDIRTVVVGIVHAAEKKVIETKAQFISVKDSFLQSIGRGLDAFKEQGIHALHKTLDFFKVKTALGHLEKSLENCAAACYSASEKAGIMQEELGAAGNHVKNIGHLFTGKQPVEVEAKRKDSGILHGIRNLLTRTGMRLSHMAQATESVIGKVEQLEQRTEKSSVRGELKAIKNTQVNNKREKFKSRERGR